MSAEVSIKADIDKAERLLDGVGRDRYVTRNIMRGVGKAAKKEVKDKYFSSGLHRRSGTLFRSIQSWTTNNGETAVVAPKRSKYSKAERAQGKRGYKTDVSYGYMLAHGATVTAKNGGYLTFKVNGRWVKVRQTRYEAHDFVEKPIKKYLESASFKTKMDELAQKEIDRIEKKMNGGRK